MRQESNDYGLWGMVALNVLIFGGFALSFLRPRRGSEWRSMGVFSAFIVALFAEMYGFPLTIYVLTSVLGAKLSLTTPYGHLQDICSPRCSACLRGQRSSSVRSAAW